MEKPIYRIKIEVIGEEQEGSELDESLRGGVDCDGFVILTKDAKNRTYSSIHRVSILDIVAMMAGSEIITDAAPAAVALNEASKKQRIKKESVDFFSSLKRKLEE